jgi:hypothetical protein
MLHPEVQSLPKCGDLSRTEGPLSELLLDLPLDYRPTLSVRVGCRRSHIGILHRQVLMLMDVGRVSRLVEMRVSPESRSRFEVIVHILN